MAEEHIHYSIIEEEPEDKVTVIDFKIYMHCNACEKTVAKVISKIKGVEKFTTDMENDRVVIMGKIDPVKLHKKLKKKIGKRVYIIENEDEDPQTPPATTIVPPLSVIDMFSDENPNACSIL